jgi:hypothetical protein
MGTAPVQRYTALVRRLFSLFAAPTADHVLVIATLDGAGATTRRSAWIELIRRAADRVGDWLPFRVLTWSQIATMAPRIRRLAAYARRAVNGQATQVDLAFALVAVTHG